MSALALLLIHAAATLFMVGLIWFVQVVHYPLFSRVGADVFAAYEVDHQRLTSRVVLPAMFIELITAFLVWHQLPAGISNRLAFTGLLLVAAVWVATFVLSVPAHRRLSKAFSEAAHRKLVYTNWIRTALWSLRGFLACWMVLSHVGSGS